jgi:hypothetical protein
MGALEAVAAAAACSAGRGPPGCVPALELPNIALAAGVGAAQVKGTGAGNRAAQPFKMTFSLEALLL